MENVSSLLDLCDLCEKNKKKIYKFGVHCVSDERIQQRQKK